MKLYSVYDADGAHFRMVDESQAERLLDHKAAIIDPKRRKIRLKLTVDHSSAKCILKPVYPLRIPRTFHVEILGDERRFSLYQHSRRCFGYARSVD